MKNENVKRINPKPQCSMPNKIPNHKSQKPFIGVWGLGFDWELGFGHWSFILMRNAQNNKAPRPPAGLCWLWLLNDSTGGNRSQLYSLTQDYTSTSVASPK